MHSNNIIISTDCIDQSNLPEFIRHISLIDGFINFTNLFAQDYARYYMRYGHGPENLNILKAFVIDMYKRDAEYYFSSRENYEGRGTFTLRQVPPLMFLYEFINHQHLGIGSFVPYDEKPNQVSDEIGLVKISCQIKLVTNDPLVMKKNLSEILVKPSGLF
mgnify:CR=1 FL=1